MGTRDAATPQGDAPQPGGTLDGKYALIRVLGTGGMGVVFEAEHLRLKQRCAIKMLSPEMLEQPEIVHRFEREARASALLRSPHVTRVTDVATTPGGLPYIVMELLKGHDLDVELQTRGRLPFPEAVDYVLQACAAVGEAHTAGIIHRDLKPANLFLAREEEGIVVKVLDFGISKIMADDSKLTTATMTMGTALYMSPEQLRSAAKVDARSDIWSLGVILYELLCGEAPFTGTTSQIAAAVVTEDAPDITKRCVVPAALGAAIHRALRRAPAERFASIGELAAELAPFAPSGSVGSEAAALISRRTSSPQLSVDTDESSERRFSVDVGAPTVPRDVSTNASHEVTTGLRRQDGAARRLLIAALVVVALVAALGVTTIAVVVLRDPAPPAPAAGPTIARAEPPLAPASASAAGTTVDASVGDEVSAAGPASPTVSPRSPAAPASGAARPPRPAASAPPPASARPVAAPHPPPAHPTSTVNPTFLN